jgi:hypothetical protein
MSLIGPIRVSWRRGDLPGALQLHQRIEREGNKEWQTLEETRNFSVPQSVLEIAIGLYEDGRA